MNEDIERFIASCKICEKYQVRNISEPMLPHDIPNRPFKKSW